jgi:hypothetical protein
MTESGLSCANSTSSGVQIPCLAAVLLGIPRLVAGWCGAPPANPAKAPETILFVALLGEVSVSGYAGIGNDDSYSEFVKPC